MIYLFAIYAMVLVLVLILSFGAVRLALLAGSVALRVVRVDKFFVGFLGKL